MYCPKCNNFVDDNRDKCPFCDADLHGEFHVSTNERQVMEKIVSSKLYVVMAAALTLYTVFAAMTALLKFFDGGGLDVFNILFSIFGGILAWRVWTLYMGTVKKAPENPRAEKMTAFFTCQKVFFIFTTVLLALGLLCLLLVLPYTVSIGNVLDKLIYEDGTMYDVVLAVVEDEEEAKLVYEEFLISSNVTEEEVNEVFDSLRDLYAKDDSIPDVIKNFRFGNMFTVVVIASTVTLVLGTVFCILFAIYMKSAARFMNDFCLTWNGYAPWIRGSAYAAGLGYFLSVILFIAALLSIMSIPASLNLLTNLSASVATFCFAKFTSKISKYMEELYKLNI